MGSFSPACEIVEVNDEQMHQIIKLSSNKSLEDDINKIFEAINLKVSSKDQILNHSVSSSISKDALKKSFRSGFPNSSDTRPSEAASLKHALRRQCISQASEMAATKRLSSPIYSPRISESGRISSLYNSVILEADTLSETKSKSEEKQEAIEKNRKDRSKSVPVQNLQISKTNLKEKKHLSDSGDIVPGLPPKPRQKGNLQQKAISSSSLMKANKGSRPARNVSHMVKPVSTNRPIIKKNLKPKMINTSPSPYKEELLCQRCQCALANQKKEDAKDLGLEDHKKVNDNSRIEKGDDFHDNNREEEEENSSMSGSISSSGRPHMSRNIKWEAIKHVIKLRGVLGLKHFNLLKKLGSGDIGTVYLAELIGTNCLFAIKVMDNDYLARRKKMQRAISEREILKMLDHPFLPTLYAEFVSDNLSCLVMEYCPGGDLHVLRQKQPGRYFPEASARFYVAEVLLALEYLHVLGVIYRDLKPENILVSEDGHIMLTDFDLSLRCEVNPTLLQFPSSYKEPPRISGPCTGSNCIDPFCMRPSCEVSCFRPWLLPKSNKVKNAKPDTKPLPQLVAEPTDARSNSFVGTHEYLAPEIIKGDGHGSAVDWWTFGILVYELLYGRTPFKGPGNDETLANVVLESLEFPESPMVSFQARDLIRELLVKDPENRLGYERGAAELKKHPFFEGLNWALIRCAIPPQLPEFYNLGVMNLMNSQEGNPEFEFF